MKLLDFIFSQIIIYDGDKNCIFIDGNKILLPERYAQNVGMDKIDPKQHINTCKNAILPINNKIDKKF